jgi:hypothetical protein
MVGLEASHQRLEQPLPPRTSEAGLRTCSIINSWPPGRSTRNASAAAARVSGIVQKPSAIETSRWTSSGRQRYPR